MRRGGEGCAGTFSIRGVNRMPFVKETARSGAGPELQALYDRVAGDWGGALPRVLQVLGLAPEAMQSVSQQARAISYGSSSLGRRTEAMIAVVVARLNGCEPLLVAHGEQLRAAGGDGLLVYHLQRDHGKAALDAREQALLAYVTKLSEAPEAIAEEDLNLLREAGYDDRAVLDVVMLTALTTFMVTVVGGLGVETEPALAQAREEAERKVAESL